LKEGGGPTKRFGVCGWEVGKQGKREVGIGMFTRDLSVDEYRGTKEGEKN